MVRTTKAFFSILFGASTLLSQNGFACVNPAYIAAQQEKKACKRGQEVAIYAYPVVMMDLVKQFATFAQGPLENKAPINQFAHDKTLFTPLDIIYKYPNVDSLVSTAWLDLTKEPLLLHIPAIAKRFFLLELFDGWTNVLASITPPITDSKAQDYLLCGPYFTGNAPDGIVALRSATNTLFISGLIQCYGPGDYQALRAIQDEFTLTPLSSFGKPYFPPPLVPYSKLNATKEPPKDQIKDMQAQSYFARFSNLLTSNPPSAQDSKVSKTMAELGIKYSAQFNIDDTDAPVEKGLIRGFLQAKEVIADNAESLYTTRNRWKVLLREVKDFGTDYNMRAYYANLNLFTRLSENMLTALIDGDSHGIKLSGTKRYRLHFNKDKLPPVSAFWSLTLYTDFQFLARNSINRYAIQSFMPSLITNNDGSLDIYIQTDMPEGPNKNWLPCPREGFSLIMRLYQPKAAAIDGSWYPPSILCRNPPE